MGKALQALCSSLLTFVQRGSSGGLHFVVRSQNGDPLSVSQSDREQKRSKNNVGLIA